MRVESYSLFGLKVQSEIALPELFVDRSDRAADVVIRRGKIDPPADARPGLHVHKGGLVLIVADVANYAIEGGHSISVDPLADAPDRNVRLFLLGSAFGALLHQRGLLPLHANAVEMEGKAVAFMGPSGSGKSTLAAWFHDRGHRVLADDVCVVAFDREGRPIAYPGLPRLRLWEEALQKFGRSAADFPRSYIGDEEWNKFDVAITEGAAREALPISHLMLLDRGERQSIRKLPLLQAAEAVFANTYRGAFVDSTGNAPTHWETAVKLIRAVPVCKLERMWDLDALDGSAQLAIDYVRDDDGEAPARQNG